MSLSHPTYCDNSLIFLVLFFYVKLARQSPASHFSLEIYKNKKSYQLKNSEMDKVHKNLY